MNTTIESLEQRNMRADLPQFKAGDTLRVHFKVIEGQRQRIQVFEGLLKRQGSGFRETFTVRSIVRRRVERTFPPTRRRSRSSSRRDRRRPARQALLLAQEWERRRASASSDSGSPYTRPRGSK